MFKHAMILLAAAAFARAEVHSLTLRQAVQIAMKQNPDIALARLEEQKARAGVRAARDPFLPHLTVGSGLAYSRGFPMSIEGSAPSLVQAGAQQYLFNRAQSFQVAQAKEDARGAAIMVTSKREEVVYRTTDLYLDAERAGRIGELARKAMDPEQAVLESIRAQVREGRVLPIAEKQAELALARTRQLSENLADDQATAETALALALGFPAEDRVRAVAEERPAPALPGSEEQAIQSAVESNQQLRQIMSQIASKQLEWRGEKATRWPRVDLVAQYAVLAKFNNYVQYFNHFQRNNAEIGMAFQLPVFRPGIGSATAATESEIGHLKIELSNARNQIASELQRSLRAVQKAQSAAEVARLDLEVAREQLSIDLAQVSEGRLTMRQVEEARLTENNKWIAFYDAQYALEKSRWNVLRMTGSLLHSIESLPDKP